MQLIVGENTIWKRLRKLSKRCNSVSAQTQFGTVLERFRKNAINFWLRHNLELSQYDFEKCNCFLAKTQIGIVLEKFRYDTIEFWLIDNLEMFQKNFGQMQLNFGKKHNQEMSQRNFEKMQFSFGSDTMGKCRRLTSITCK